MQTFGPADQIGRGNYAINAPSSGAVIGKALALVGGSGDEWQLGFVDFPVVNSAAIAAALGYVAADDANVLHRSGNETKNGKLTVVSPNNNVEPILSVLPLNLTQGVGVFYDGVRGLSNLGSIAIESGPGGSLDIQRWNTGGSVSLGHSAGTVTVNSPTTFVGAVSASSLASTVAGYGIAFSTSNGSYIRADGYTMISELNCTGAASASALASQVMIMKTPASGLGLYGFVLGGDLYFDLAKSINFRNGTGGQTNLSIDGPTGNSIFGGNVVMGNAISASTPLVLTMNSWGTNSSWSIASNFNSGAPKWSVISNNSSYQPLLAESNTSTLSTGGHFTANGNVYTGNAFDIGWTDAQFGRVSAGAIGVFAANGTTLANIVAANLPFSFVLANDVSTAADTALVNVTGLVFNFEANSTYVIDLYGLVASAIATTGVGFAIDTSVAVTNVALTFSHQLATAGTISGGSSIADAVASGVSSGVPTANTLVPINGRGVLVTGASAGSAQLQLRAEVAGVVTVRAGTVLVIRKV
jgi:hypothetical protein